MWRQQQDTGQVILKCFIMTWNLSMLSTCHVKHNFFLSSYKRKKKKDGARHMTAVNISVKKQNIHDFFFHSTFSLPPHTPPASKQHSDPQKYVFNSKRTIKIGMLTMNPRNPDNVTLPQKWGPSSSGWTCRQAPLPGLAQTGVPSGRLAGRTLTSQG